MNPATSSATPEALRRSEECFRLLVDAVKDYAIYMLDEEGIVASWNSGAERIKGYQAEQILGQSFACFFASEDRDQGKPAALLAQAKTEGQAKDQGWRLRKDGSRFMAEAVLTAIRGEGGALIGFAKVTQDITQRKAMEELQASRDRLAESERRYRNLAEELRRSKHELDVILNGVDNAITAQDATGKLVFANPAAARQLGYPTPQDLLDASLPEVMARYEILDEDGNPFPLDRIPGRLVLRGESSGVVVMRYREVSTGRERWSLVKSSPVLDGDGRVGMAINFFHDISELKEAEDKLRQSQKMEAVGQLAGGIAHDFNNLLTAINGYSDLILSQLARTDGKFFENVTEIRKAGERAASLTQQLLAFSRKQILAPKILDLSEVVGSMETLLRRLIGENIQLLTVLPPGLSKVKADPGQIEQVILNLALNARDAMPQGGKLILEIADVDLDDAYAGTHLESKPGTYVMLAVTDSGIGMDPHVKGRLFEPFFTTKGVGKGTGLGLSTVFGIVKQSGGSIHVYSEPERGTTFKIYFPTAKSKSKARGASTSLADLGKEGSWQDGPGGETILVVEDEESVRKLVNRTLFESGYHCLSAQDAETALEISRNHPGPIHLLLTDVILQGMNGKVLAEKLRPLRPEMEVLFMSGYTDNAIIHQGVLDEGTGFLNKPFSAQALKHRIRKSLAKQA